MPHLPRNLFLHPLFSLRLCIYISAPSPSPFFVPSLILFWCSYDSAPIFLVVSLAAPFPVTLHYSAARCDKAGSRAKIRKFRCSFYHGPGLDARLVSQNFFARANYTPFLRNYVGVARYATSWPPLVTAGTGPTCNAAPLADTVTAHSSESGLAPALSPFCCRTLKLLMRSRSAQLNALQARFDFVAQPLRNLMQRGSLQLSNPKTTFLR